MSRRRILSLATAATTILGLVTAAPPAAAAPSAASPAPTTAAATAAPASPRALPPNSVSAPTRTVLPAASPGSASAASAPQPAAVRPAAVLTAQPSSSCAPTNLLQNASFEKGGSGVLPPYWVRGTGISAAQYQDARSHDGLQFLQLNTTVSGSFISQNAAVAPAPGDTFTFSVWLKSDNGNTMTGAIRLGGVGSGSGADYGAVNNLAVGPTWELFSAAFTARTSGETSLQVQLFLTNTYSNLDVDGAQLIRAGMTDASLETTPVNTGNSPWQPSYGGSTGTFSQIKSSAPIGHEGPGYAEMNATTAGNSQVNPVATTTTTGSTYTFSTWLRSADGTPYSGALYLYATGGAQEISAPTPYTVGPTWQYVTVSLRTLNPGHTALYPVIAMGTVGHNLQVDAAQLRSSCILDSSFDSPKSSTPWTASSGLTYTPTTTGTTFEGASYGDLVTTAAGATLTQVLGFGAAQNATQTLSMWVRSGDGTPVSGGLTLGGDGSADAWERQSFTAGPAWTLVTVPFQATVAHSATHIDVTVSTTGKHLEVDGATLNGGNAAGLSVPAIPASAAATVGATQATVSWARPSTSVGGAVAGYTITPYIGGTAQAPTSVGAAATNVTITGLQSGTTYTFRVAATNTTGVGPAFTTTAVTTGMVTGAGPPQSVQANRAGSTAAVSWVAPTNAGGGTISGYTVTTMIGSFPQPSLTVTAGAGATTTTVTGLDPNTLYGFVVQADNQAGHGTASTTADPPGIPSNVRATTTSGRAQVTWSAPLTNGSPLTRYTVTPYLGGTAQASLAVVVTTRFGGAITTSASLSGLTDGSVYTFQVTPANAWGTGPAASSQAAQPAPAAPLGISAGTGYSAGATAAHVVVTDVTGDGWSDIVVPGDMSKVLSTLGNVVRGGGHAGGTFSGPVLQDASTTPVGHTVLHDVNGDGKLDAVFASNSNAVGVALGDGAGHFAAPSYVPATPGLQPLVVAVGDLNGDGLPDIVMGAYNSYPGAAAVVSVFLNTGNGTFGAPANVSLDTCLGCAWNPAGLAIADINGDGLPDVVLLDVNGTGGSMQQKPVVLLNVGGGTLKVGADNPQTGSAGSARAGDALVVADLNGDGIPDVVTLAAGTNGIGIYIAVGNGDGTLASPVLVSDQNLPAADRTGGVVTGIALADLNGDGLPDVVTSELASTSTGQGPGGISVYLNRGGGGIDAPTFIPTPGFGPTGVALGDVNGDSVPDVVLENGTAPTPQAPNNILVMINGTSFPPLGSALAAGEMHGCFMCQSVRGGGALEVSGNYPITVNSGEMSHTFTDLAIPARGFPLAITQTYNDLAAGTDAGMGYGWWSPILMSVTADASTGITSVTQENGATAQFRTSGLTAVSPRTQATLVHNADGTWTFTRYHGESFTFNATGHIASVADLTGDTLTFGYTGTTVTSLTHGDGRSLAIAWANGHVSQITDANVAGTTRTVTLAYDASNQLTDITWAVNGGSARNEHFEYASSTWAHGMTGMRDPRGTWVTQVYDAFGRATSQTVDPAAKNPGGLNRTTTYAYTLSGSVITSAVVTDPANHAEQDVFAYGERIQKTVGYGTSTPQVWHFGFDRSSIGTTTTIDPAGQVTSASYDTYGNVLATVDPLSRVSSATYSTADAPHNQPTTTTDAAGTVTTNTWDPAYRTLTQSSTLLTDPAPSVNRVVQYQHTTPGHPGDVTAVVDPYGKTWPTTYTAHGEVATSADPLGNTSSSTYNNDGWLLASVTPKGAPAVCTTPCTPATYTTRYGYVDDAGVASFTGQVSVVTDPLGHVSKTSYDADGNVAKAVDPDQNTTTYDHDAAGEPTVTHRANATTTSTSYNADGTVHQQIDGAGQATTYTYDALGRLQSTYDPVHTASIPNELYGYDGLNRPVTLQQPGGNCAASPAVGCITTTCDAAGQRTGTTYSDASTPNVTNVQYDADGRRTAMTDGTGTSTWSWDSLGRLKNQTDGSGNAVSYAYSVSPHTTTITYPAAVHGGAVTQTYDAAGRLHTVSSWLAGDTTTFNDDANSNPSTTVFAAITGVTDTWTHNAADQLTAISDANSGGAFATFTYTRDNAGQLASQSATGVGQATETYGYSALNQLHTVNSGSYGYDNADNLTGMTSGATLTYNTANQLQAMTAGGATTTYGFDNRGNRTSFGLQGGIQATLAYDQVNRLKGAGGVAYTYNGDGLRVRKGTGETFVWAGSTLLADGSTAFLYGADGAPLEQISWNGTTGVPLYFHHDQLGSTRALTSATGAVAATYSYDPYGNKTASTAAGSTPLQYAGEYTDAESGYQYLRARYYDPGNGQFLTRDPLVTQTRSPYAYVAGNPLNGSDPSGMIFGLSCDWCGDAAGWVGDHAGAIAGTALFVGAAACVFVSDGVCAAAVGDYIVTTLAGLGGGGGLAAATAGASAGTVASVAAVSGTAVGQTAMAGVALVGAGAIYGSNCSFATPTSQNQMKKQFERDQVPSGIDRVDPPHGDAPGAQPHIHFKNKKSALNQDGSWHDGDGSDVTITRKIANWIKGNGWSLP